MQRKDFHYTLPDELIAHYPKDKRTASRLLVLDGVTGNTMHQHFTDIFDHLSRGDLLIFNDTKVIPARIFAQKQTGGKIEILIERITGQVKALAHIKASKAPKPNSFLVLENGMPVEVVGRQGSLFELRFPEGLSILDLLDQIGHMPLPPYIDRAEQVQDKERYQTVYGKHPGAVAAPTAGLHFDNALLNKLEEKGISKAFVTLHVGAGTFQPVRANSIDEHIMHSEYMHIDQATCDIIAQTKAQGGKVVAVGTTSVRTLETAAQDGALRPYQNDTDIFIYPGFQYRVVDALITNFHLPESTLLMLVSAFAGYKNTMKAYEQAVQRSYRFFSYGDAMFIKHNPEAYLEIPGES